MTDILRVNSLGQTYGRSKVLDNVTFTLEAGDRLAVVGASGSGKTTLLRLIAGLEAPATGEITVAGKLVSRGGEVLVAPQRREIALVFQGLALFPHLRALDQIAFAVRGRGGRQRAQELLDQIGLSRRADARLDELSGGERQRVALARALAQEPKLILMDEPFASLDDDKRSEMRDLLRSLLDKSESRQTTLILVTHAREDAFDLARRVLVLQQGRPVACDLLETVLSRPQHATAVRALGLGQIVAGKVVAAGQVETVFGKLAATSAAAVLTTGLGRVSLLVRPGQPRIAADGEGVEGEVVSLELRAPEERAMRRVAIVRVASVLLRVFTREQVLTAGQRVRVRIDGDCEVVAGE